MSAKAGKSISGKFNVLVVDMSIFHVFGIVEKYLMRFFCMGMFL